MFALKQAEAGSPKAETGKLKAEANTRKAKKGMTKAKKKKAKAAFTMAPLDGKILQAKTRIIKAIL